MVEVVYLGNVLFYALIFAGFTQGMHSTSRSVCRCETAKATKSKVRIWGRAPENAQVDERVVLTSTGKGAACSKVFATPPRSHPPARR